MTKFPMNTNTLTKCLKVLPLVAYGGILQQFFGYQNIYNDQSMFGIKIQIELCKCGVDCQMDTLHIA
jgi:hypothetical protein